ncbi:MAG: hypothetical protein NTX15_02155, partial [Candidatus Kapabacteria bacterium]|nr:hypothetical protein [Candidatus Kapabacteria bacterium]
ASLRNDHFSCSQDADDLFFREMFPSHIDLLSTTKLSFQLVVFLGSGSLYQDAVAKIDAMLKEHGTHKLQLNSYRVAAYYHLYVEDFESVLKTCDRAMEYLDQHPHLSQRARYGEFNLQKLSTAVFVRRFEDAYQMSDKCIGSFAEAGNNWYFATDMAFVAAINLRDFQKAENYYVAATSHRKYNALNVSFKERWTLYGAYLHLAERLDLYSSKQSRSKPFRLSTYLNSLPAESKSKKVYNVFIIISHVFFLMLDGDFDLAEKRIEYLRVYSSRYLKEKQLNRVRLFLRLIQSFPKHSFIPDEIRKNSKALFHELEATARDPMPSDTNELIPFELMYEALLRSMEKNS